ncbi:hypothetical protein DI487_15435 [Flavobacterium sediminis]|uniref:Uncharacterized protein n=1 Tax=Flavobacterium sediminis TaxID=2201181 RepID=A0A2U8QYW3_9FLAO|nr:hypothetical protein DI487_15435 [Flavobacterium sediminis]
MLGLVRNSASTHQTENPRGFSEVGENKQLLIAIVGGSYFLSFQFHHFSFSLSCLSVGVSAKYTAHLKT